MLRNRNLIVAGDVLFEVVPKLIEEFKKALHR